MMPKTSPAFAAANGVKFGMARSYALGVQSRHLVDRV